jgi:dipeptidyl aminopeptidase/acylaminoacyl peptidase
MGDYGLWRTVSSTKLSNDGNWMTFDYRKPEAHKDAPDERKLQIKNLTSDKIYEIPFGINPKFSDDSNWIAYMIDLDRKEAKKLKDQKKPVQQKVQLLNLETGEKITWENATSFGFSKSSSVLAIRKPKEKGLKHAGSDLIVHDFKNNLDHHFGSVSQYSFNKPGTHLAYTRDAADKTANGLYYMNFDTGLRTPLDQGAATYSQMTWDEDGTALAALKGNEKEGFKQMENQLIAFTGLGTDSLVRHELNPAENRNFPEDTVISEKGRLSWNTDTTKVFFGIKAQEVDPKSKKPEKDSENGDDKDGEAGDDKDKKNSQPPDLDIWHWKDLRIQSVQRARANRERNFTYRSVYNLEAKKFVQLADETMRDITITRDGKWGVGSDEREYIHDWKPPMADYYRVDTTTGERQPILTKLKRSMGVSPDSKYFVYWSDAHIWVHDLESGTTRNLTKEAPVSFADMEYDFYAERPPYGLGGWTKDGKAIILNHRYDLWLQPLNGSPAINLTSGVGAENEMVLRTIRLDRQERFIDLSQPVMLSAYGQWTKKAGFYKLDAGGVETGSINKPERLIYDDKSFGRLRKAKDADQYMVTIESFTECPDYYVTDATFDNPRRITNANPQQAEFNWGHRVLFDYTNDDGVRLQAALAIPDTRKPGERLPMLVSFYEKRSQNMNSYLRPRLASNPITDLMETVSKGYLLLSPDIHFNIGTPEDDKLECIVIAVAKAVELGYADPDRVALMGHSYSAYGGTYIAARSDKFAAGVVMAGTMNFISDFNHLWGSEPDRKEGSGVNAHRYNIYEQGRMGTNPYDDFDLYWWQGPISHVKTLDTPLLYIHGESDNTVAWIEGVELYNAMRFNGKNIIFLSYAKEGHSLSKRANKMDMTRRMLEYLDYYLMDKPAADWINNGVPFLEKNK